MSETIAGEGVAKGSYKGGFLGLKAIVEAFNGWDMLKATGRSARWLFKGRKTRHTDASYSLNRKDTDESNFSGQGQKLSTLNNQTAYNGGATTLPPYAGGVDEEDANLLANSQSMPSSQPTAFRTEGHYDSNNASDIGLASSTYDDKYTRRYDPPQHPPPQQSYPPYPSSLGAPEIGVTAPSYPGSFFGGPSSSHIVPPRSPDPSLRRGPEEGPPKGNGGGNFF